jgi:hypothetical protein
MSWPDLLFEWMIVTPSGMVFMHAYGVFWLGGMAEGYGAIG